MKPSERDVEMAEKWWRAVVDIDSPAAPQEIAAFAAHLAQAREEGRLLGLEQAAVYCETHAYTDHETARPGNIRALGVKVNP